MSNIEQELLFWRITGVLIIIGVTVVGIFMFRAFRWTQEAKFRRVYDGIVFQSVPKPDTVLVTFCTYDGFLAWVTETTHHGYATADDARLLLRRLHYYNLTWGLFCYGMIFVPFISFFHYRQQMKAIDRQSNISEMK